MVSPTRRRRSIGSINANPILSNPGVGDGTCARLSLDPLPAHLRSKIRTCDAVHDFEVTQRQLGHVLTLTPV